MKIYTPPQATNDPSYLSYSKEPDRIKPDQSLGTLFENIGEVGSMALKGIDNIMQSAVKDEANQVNDASMSEGLQMQMVGLGIQPKPGDAVAGGQDPVGDSILPREPSLPAGVKDEALAAKNRISTMESSVRAGKYPHVQWLMEREALSRSLRARYPGYRDQIDAVLGNTANTLYAALQAETTAKATAAQAQQNKVESQLYQKSEWVSQLYPDFYANRQKYLGQENVVLNEASKLEARKVQMETRKKELDLAAQEGAPIDLPSQTKRTLTDFASTEANTVILSAIKAMGFKNEQDFENRLAQLKSGAPAKKDEIEGMTMIADAMQRKYEAAMLRHTSSPLGGNGHTINGIISGAESQKIIQEQGRIISLFKDAVVNKDVGILGHLKRIEEGQTDSLRREMYQQFPYLRSMEILRSTTGGGMTFDAAMQNSGLTARLGKDAKSLLGLGMSEMLTQGTPFGQVVDKWRKAIGGNELATLNGGAIDNSIAVITQPDSAPQLAANMGKSMFGDQTWFARVPVDEKPEVFRKLSAESVAAAMWKQGQQDPIHWQRYKGFMEKAAKDALHRERSEIAGFQADGWLSEKSPLQLVMNPQTMQIEVAKTGGAGFTPGMNQHLQQVEFAMKKQIAPLNAMLGGLKNVYSKEKAEISPDLLNQLAVMGIRIPGQSAEMDPETGWVGTPAGLGPGSTGASRSISTRPNDAVGSGDPLKDLILSAESNNNYDAVFGQKNIKLTDMTLDEVLAHQAKSAAQGYKSTAVGGFQFIQKTLKGLKDELGLTGTEKFDATLQNRLADALLERRGLSKFKAGKLSPDAFADELAKEWAALPTIGGKSFYDGDGLNRATIPRRLLTEALRNPPKDVMAGGGDDGIVPLKIEGLLYGFAQKQLTPAQVRAQLPSGWKVDLRGRTEAIVIGPDGKEHRMFY
jgi:hypothetical protein